MSSLCICVISPNIPLSLIHLYIWSALCVTNLHNCHFTDTVLILHRFQHPDTDAVLTPHSLWPWRQAPWVLCPSNSGPGTLHGAIPLEGLTNSGCNFLKEAAFLTQHAPHHTLVSTCCTGPPPHSAPSGLSPCSEPLCLPYPRPQDTHLAWPHLPALGLSCSGRTKWRGRGITVLIFK